LSYKFKSLCRPPHGIFELKEKEQFFQKEFFLFPLFLLSVNKQHRFVARLLTTFLIAALGPHWLSALLLDRLNISNSCCFHFGNKKKGGTVEKKVFFCSSKKK
jgi:hypothetical protein